MQTSITSPIRLKSIQRAMKQKYEQERQEREVHLYGFCNAETALMSVTRPMNRIAPVTRPMLPLDTHGRVYVASSGVPGDTLSLIKEAVAKYFAYQQSYPTEILLSPLRFLIIGKKTHYKINGVVIPVRFEDASYVENHFDVMVRGGK